MTQVQIIKEVYSSKKPEIESRLKEFQNVKGDKDVFAELVFCLLTPQSKAKACWKAVCSMKKKGILHNGGRISQIRRQIKAVRFRNKKARYIQQAKRLFINNGRPNIKSRLRGFKDSFTAREWLVKNVRGMGYKEASHFLRNIGLGLDLAILDRHILKNLKLFRVIGEVPSSLYRNRYLEIEKKMRRFADKIKIPTSHLDLILWYKETGGIFK